MLTAVCKHSKAKSQWKQNTRVNIRLQMALAANMRWLWCSEKVHEKFHKHACQCIAWFGYSCKLVLDMVQ